MRNWTAEQVGPGLVIIGDSAAIRIDTDGISWDGPSVTTTTFACTIAGQEVTITEMMGGNFFSLKRTGDIPSYYFRIVGWTNSVDKVLSTFKSW